ncbi:MAG: VOC family protein [Sphingomonadales bacterium]|nr:VOC family protein [Sphingomonadales bacterium]
MLESKAYQIGYVCDDIEACIDVFMARGLKNRPTIIPVDQMVNTADGPKRHKLRICMFWLDGEQYELIEPEIDETGHYANAQANGGPMRFHHHCQRVADWDDFRARVDQQDLPVAFERYNGPDSLNFLYLDGRKAFGHYLEYVAMPDAMWNQINGM